MFREFIKFKQTRPDLTSSSHSHSVNVLCTTYFYLVSIWKKKYSYFVFTSLFHTFQHWQTFYSIFFKEMTKTYCLFCTFRVLRSHWIIYYSFNIFEIQNIIHLWIVVNKHNWCFWCLCMLYAMQCIQITNHFHKM